MSWADVEDAMHTAVARASGFDPSQITWSYANANEPALDHITIDFGGALEIGIDRVKTTIDLTRPGQEVKQELKGIREAPFEVQVFTADRTGDAAARHVAELIRSRIRLPNARALLRKANVVPFDSDPVQWVPDIPSAAFRGRASVTLRCYVPLIDCVEYTTYIARVRGTIVPRGVATGSSAASGIPFAFTVG